MVVNGIGDLLAGVRADAAAAPFDYLGLKMMVCIFGHTTLATRVWAFSKGVGAIQWGASLPRACSRAEALRSRSDSWWRLHLS